MDEQGFVKCYIWQPLVACRYNSRMKVFYDRLIAKGKAKKGTIIAVLRKMIVVLNAMVKTDMMWQKS